MTIHRNWIKAFFLTVAVSVLGAVAIQAVASRTTSVRLPPMMISPGAARPTEMIIGVGIHRESTGFDAGHSDDAQRGIGFVSVRDEIGQSSGNAPGGLLRSLALGGTLSSPLQIAYQQ